MKRCKTRKEKKEIKKDEEVQRAKKRLAEPRPGADKEQEICGI